MQEQFSNMGNCMKHNDGLSEISVLHLGKRKWPKLSTTSQTITLMWP